jgi:hypothetical protein
VVALLASALLLTPQHRGEPSLLEAEASLVLDSFAAVALPQDQRGALLPVAAVIPAAPLAAATGTLATYKAAAAAGTPAAVAARAVAAHRALSEVGLPSPHLVQKNVLRRVAAGPYPLDGSSVGPAASESLWELALGAATVRGESKKGGGSDPRLSAFKSKRVGPRRHDGLSFKAGEDGCPPKPKGAGKFTKGDERLTTVHFVHPPKSGGTTFGLVTVCEMLKPYTHIFQFRCLLPPIIPSYVYHRLLSSPTDIRALLTGVPL